MSTLRPRNPLRGRRRALVGVLLAVVVGGCSSGTYQATPVPSQSGSSPVPSTPTTSPTSTTCDQPLRSYAPPAAVPADGALASYPTVSAIRERKRLIVGVSADSLLLASRNPLTGKLEGFDIDMARLVAQAIFGDPNKVELRVITAAERVPSLRDHTVDLVARNMTINCDRWKQIAFSAEYYRSGQKLLVSAGEKATTLEGLADNRVCAPTASTSLDKLREFPKVLAVTASTHTGCLVKFQQGEVDAITGDDTVLAGLAAQDPYTRVVGKAFTDEPYGLGMNSEAKDLVRYVNAVLARAKADGQWRAAYNRWFAKPLGPAPAPPAPVYGR